MIKKRMIRSAVLVCSMVISSMLMDFKVSASDLSNGEVEHHMSTSNSSWWIGRDGEVSEADEETFSRGISVYCAHNLVPGDLAIHNKKDDGSCVTSLYNAARCYNCDTIFIYSLKNVIEFTKCIH